MSRKLHLADQLIIPFGRPKWSIEKIKIKQVSSDGTHIESSDPFAYIDKSKNRPLQIADFWDVIPDSFLEKFQEISRHHDREQYSYGVGVSRTACEEFNKRFDLIHDYLKSQCELDTKEEGMFLDIYFEHWRYKSRYGDDDDVHSEFYWMQMQALLPLPQAHLYLDDRLSGENYMQKADFAFWTGDKVIAVEIDGDGKRMSDVAPRERRYKDAGIEVVHILNSEIKQYGPLIMNLLPKELQDIKCVGKMPRRSPYIVGFDCD